MVCVRHHRRSELNPPEIGKMSLKTPDSVFIVEFLRELNGCDNSEFDPAKFVKCFSKLGS